MNHVTKCAEALREKFTVLSPKADELCVEEYSDATTEEIVAVIRPFIEEAVNEAIIKWNGKLNV